LLHLIATVSPGAKKGSTAPYTYAELVLLEAGSRQPRTLSNAFRKPAELGGDVRKDALLSLSTYVSGLDQVYGQHEVRAGFCIGADSEYIESIGATPKTLAGLSDWIRSAVVSAQV
jgi:CRISPR system Cascade subunit CasC